MIVHLPIRTFGPYASLYEDALHTLRALERVMSSNTISDGIVAASGLLRDRRPQVPIAYQYWLRQSR